jgi:hypothetical protein
MTSHEVYDDTASKDEKEAWQAKDDYGAFLTAAAILDIFVAQKPVALRCVMMAAENINSLNAQEMRQMIHWLDEIKRVDRLIRQAATCVVGRHFLFYTQRVPQRITRVADVPSDLHG